MLGFIFGTLCLIALVRVIARRRWGWHGHHHFRGGYGGWGPRGALNHVLARLETAPGQEKVISQAFSDFVDQARTSGRDVRDTRQAVAEALRGPELDEARLNEVFGRHDAALEQVRRAGVDAMRRVHEALDERQRKLLGELVESGLHGYGHHGYGRHGAGHHGYGRHACGAC